jgi:hypothetical protein
VRVTRTLAWVLLALAAPSCAGRRGPALRAPAAEDPFALVGFGPAWPRVLTGVESRYFSSFDRAGGNEDGFTGRYSSLYRLPSGEHVIFDALGPGVLRTLWFTGPHEGGAGLDLGRIRFYFDDEQRPRLETDQERLFGGLQPPFTQPLVADNKVSTGGYVSWVPLAYRRRLLVTTERRPSFYIAQYDTFPVDATLASWRPGADLSAARRLFAAAARCPAGHALSREVPLDFQHRGEGTIELVQFRPARPPSRDELERARVQIRWDGAPRPAVDVPLGLFFGSGLGEAPVRSLAFCMARGVYENRLPMPFWQGFHLRVSGIAGTLAVALAPPRWSRREAGHLHATYREESPTHPERDFEWLDLEGAGKLVGTVLVVLPPTPETKRWWEGDLRSYADGRRTPGLHGTGHEDDHLGGWSNTFLTGPFSLPMHGEPRTEVTERQGEQYNARTTMYRLWPGIHFLSSIRHSVEHGSENGVQADYRGVVFYYVQPGGPRLVQTDRLALGDTESRRRHRFDATGGWQSSELTSAFEGRDYRRTTRATVLAHSGPARFVLAAPPVNRGCFLRRMYDQKEARQRARILVHGREVADWYTAEGNASLRWAERDLFLPAALTSGQSELLVEVRPRAGGPEWSGAEYRLLCVTASE